MNDVNDQAGQGRRDESQSSSQAAPVSVIIPLGRQENLAAICLRSVLSQEFATPFEVIVVADEDDPSPDLLIIEFPSIQVARTPAGVGPGGGRNCGIDRAAGRYLAFIDADCVARRDWLSKIVAACRANSGWPVCGWAETSDGWRGLASDMAERGIARPNKPIAIPGIWGCNMCVSKRALEGGAHFAEGLYGAEEICLLQTMASPVRVVLDPSAVVLHLRRQTFRQSMRRMYALGRGSGIVRRRMPVRGSVIARSRWLLPLLPVGRLATTAWRVTKCGIRQVLIFAVLWPLVLLYLLWYTAGFAAGAFGKDQMNPPGARDETGGGVKA